MYVEMPGWFNRFVVARKPNALPDVPMKEPTWTDVTPWTRIETVEAFNRLRATSHPNVPMDNPNTSGQPQVPLRTYDVTDEQFKAVDNRFVFHSPKPDQQPRYVAIREKFRELAHFILAHTPPSREQSHALTLLDDASFNTNAAIARNE